MRNGMCDNCGETKKIFVTSMNLSICAGCVISIAKSMGILKASLTAEDISKRIDQIEKDIEGLKFMNDLRSGKIQYPYHVPPKKAHKIEDDEDIPKNEIHFKMDGKTVGKIVNVGLPEDEVPTVETPTIEELNDPDLLKKEQARAEYWQKRCDELDNLNSELCQDIGRLRAKIGQLHKEKFHLENSRDYCLTRYKTLDDCLRKMLAWITTWKGRTDTHKWNFERMEASIKKAREEGKG